MKPTEISVTEAARRFAELCSRVRYAGESFVVMRDGESMCRIGPAEPGQRATVSEFCDQLGRGSGCDRGFADDLEQARRQQPRLPASPWAT